MIIKSFSINGRKNLLIKCVECDNNYVQQERLYAKAKWKDRCRDHRKTEYSCMDCGCVVDRVSERCKPCSGKNRRVPVRKCTDCGINITHKAKSRCLPCHNISQDKGLSRQRTKFNASPKWKLVREAAFIRDDYTCQCCNTKGGHLNGHHIYPYAIFEEKRLEVSNIETLCSKCHKMLHRKYGTSSRIKGRENPA